MGSKAANLDKAFVEQQRVRLIKLREELLSTTRAEVAEETNIQDQSVGEALEKEDDAQKLTQLEIDGTLVRVVMQRLPAIDRALRKIENGTYGFSDVSGKSIPRDRLEAIPEAIYTVAEEEARDLTR